MKADDEQSTTPVSIAYPTTSEPIQFAVHELERVLEGPIQLRDLETDTDGTLDADIVIASTDTITSVLEDSEDAFQVPNTLSSEGFRRTKRDLNGAIGMVVVAPKPAGAMYGTLDLAEQIDLQGSIAAVEETTCDPEVPFRALKFNLPWSVYHGGEQAEPHVDTCRDLDFWESFLDMMARNRFNALTLWNLHPFPFMVRTGSFPEACPFSSAELAEWQHFWHELFDMAADRCIDTYVVNWNILVSPEFAAANDVDEWNDTSERVRKYTREHVREILEEYETLTGLGVSLCDWMGGLSPAEKQTWFEDTFLEAIEQVDRPVEILDRSVLTESIDEMRRGIDSAAAVENVTDVYVPTKFNWSHGHSTSRLELTHDYSSGMVDDSLWNPKPENYDLVWTVRNEDFFILRWGDPEFVREHIAENHTPNEYVSGYIIGSEVNIPAVDVSHKQHSHKTWQYAFEKQWLFYALWGRLLYDPQTPNDVFERMFDRRYRSDVGERLLEGYHNASQMALEFASFHAGTWDYTLYSEGFLAPVEESFGFDDGVSSFVSVDELIYHEPLDSTYVSIPDFVENQMNVSEETISPNDVADTIDTTGEKALEIANSIREEREAYTGALIETGESRGRRAEAVHNEYSGALECELDDLTTWGYLSKYFAAKLRGGIALEQYRRNGEQDAQRRAVRHLEAAAEYWKKIIAVTKQHYQEVPYATDWIEGGTFSWANYLDQVERDIRIAETAEPDMDPRDDQDPS